MSQHLDDFEREQEALFQRQMAFLASRTPDDWHRFALNHNWGDRLDGLFWIVSQPDCDKATAVLIFWTGEPTGYDWQEESEPMGADEYAVAPMLKYIVQRYNAGGYPRSEIAYDFRADHGRNLAAFADADRAGRVRDIAELVERQAELNDPSIRLHPDLMALTIPGRRVGGYADQAEFYDLFPE